MTEALSIPAVPDRFADETLIGAGGTAVVFRAWDHRLGRTVAVKVYVPRHGSLTPEEVRDRELDAASMISAHPYVCVPTGSGFTQQGAPYVVTEYHPDGSLHDQVIANGPLDLARVIRFGVCLAGVLATAHSRGLVHGDIKPANVLISQGDQPVLADFSAAVMSGDATGRTAGFVAPELNGTRESAPPADVYALGRTLLVALFGFASEETDSATVDPDQVEPVAAMISVAPRRARVIRRDDPLVVLLESCVAEDPARRPTPLELARSLRMLQRSMGLELTPVPLLGSLRELPLSEPPQVVSTGPADARRRLAALALALITVANVIALIILGLALS